MKLADILNAKTLKFTAVTIVLGAIGSGAWEWLLRPALAGSTDFLLSVGTLGVKTFKDSVYADIARGLHEGASLRLVSFVFSFGPGVLTGSVFMLLFAYHRVKAEKEPVPSLVSDRLFAAVSVSMVVFLTAFSLIQAVQISYVNRAATHFDQLLNIAGPHLTDSERILYRSRFAQIATREDYASLVHSLDVLCRKNKFRTPEFDVW
jgi:hypothetical protein